MRNKQSAHMRRYKSGKRSIVNPHVKKRKKNFGFLGFGGKKEEHIPKKVEPMNLDDAVDYELVQNYGPSEIMNLAKKNPEKLSLVDLKKRNKIMQQKQRMEDDMGY